MTHSQTNAPASISTDTALNCYRCGYNLTGLPADICPECGNRFDRQELLHDPELRRIGTPVHRARGLLKVPALALTLLQVAFLPWKFARQLRVDESKWPAILVLMTVVLLAGMCLSDWRFHLLHYAGTITAIAVSVVTFMSSCTLGVLGKSFGSRHWAPDNRWQTFASFFSYTSWFILAWFLFAPIRFISWNDPRFYWPFIAWPYYSTESVIRSILFYWWILIVYCFVLVRTRPRMLAILLLPLVLALGRFAFLVYDGIIPRLSR